MTSPRLDFTFSLKFYFRVKKHGSKFKKKTQKTRFNLTNFKNQETLPSISIPLGSALFVCRSRDKKARYAKSDTIHFCFVLIDKNNKKMCWN